MIAADWQEIVTTLGTTVRNLRRLLGWSQQNLADYAVVSQGLISRLERGECAAVPLHSVVVVLRTLAAGAAPLDLALSQGASDLLRFATNGTVAQIEARDPDFVTLARALATIPPRNRPPFMAIVRAAATALGDEAALPDEDT